MQNPFGKQDGVHWARIEGPHYSGALFDVGEVNEWDPICICRPTVLNCGQKQLRMYYASLDLQDQRYKIGFATSQNGLKWKKQGSLFNGSQRFDFDAKGAMDASVVLLIP